MFGTIARKKKTLDNLMDTVLKVCDRKTIPSPKKVLCDSSEEDDIISKIVNHSKQICKEVCTYEDENYSRYK